MSKSGLLFCLILLSWFLVSSCTVTSEKYRYQGRFDSFFHLLNDTEKDAFRMNDLNAFASSLEKRLAADTKLNESWRKMQFNEAITSFDAAQTAHFFHDVMLRELNRPRYMAFMKFLKADAQADFARNNQFEVSGDSLYQTDSSFKSFIDNMKTEYRLYGFSNKQVYEFFRSVSFPEVSRRNLYSILKTLKSAQAIDDFKAGRTAEAADKLEKAVKSIVTLDYELEKIRTDTGLTKVDIATLVDIYAKVVMKEMDQNAVIQTLAKF